MTKEMKLESLEKELNYYRTEYNWKMSNKKKKELNQVLNELKFFFKKDNCNLSQQNSAELIVKKKNNVCIVKPAFDYTKEPKAAKQFLIQVKKFEEVTCDLTIRLVIDESSMPEPDINRLLINPYKGMNSIEIEIYERKRSIDYMKKFINDDDEKNTWNFWCLDNLSDEETLHKTMDEFYSRKVHNFLFNK